MTLSPEAPSDRSKDWWPVAKIPGSGTTQDEGEVTEVSAAPPMMPPERPTLSDREERRRETLDANGVPMGRAYEMTSGTYLDKFPIAAAHRVIRKTHHHPSKVPDGDIGLNDPYYAGPKGATEPTETDLVQAAKLAEQARQERIQRDITRFILEDGMEREKAEDRAYALHRARTGEIIERPRDN